MKETVTTILPWWGIIGLVLFGYLLYMSAFILLMIYGYWLLDELKKLIGLQKTVRGELVPLKIQSSRPDALN